MGADGTKVGHHWGVPRGFRVEQQAGHVTIRWSASRQVRNSAVIGASQVALVLLLLFIAGAASPILILMGVALLALLYVCVA